VNGRDENGRFVKGHSGNPNGRKPKSVEEKYLAAIKKAVTQKELTQIFQSMAARAKAGDVRAARLIVEYLIGKPDQNIFADLKNSGELLVRIVGGFVDQPPDST
jgi:hypothetical protein